MSTVVDPYREPFYITDPVSNNTFSIKKRIHKRIYVTSLKEGKVEDVRIGSKIVFEDMDEDGAPIPCLGLEHFVKTSLKKIPTYIFDNHNHAFTFWCAENAKGKLQNDALLIHIDQHKDTRKPKSYLSNEDIKDMKKVEIYTNTVLNVGNFIPAAQEAGVIHDVVIIDSIASMDSFEKDDRECKNMILDIDLDFFSNDMEYISSDYKVEFIRDLIPYASIITIATSPFFIEQRKAIHWLKEITQGFQK